MGGRPRPHVCRPTASKCHVTLRRECLSFLLECLFNYAFKHLCTKLNDYGDNCQREVWSSGGSTHCTCQLTSLIERMVSSGLLRRENLKSYKSYQSLSLSVMTNDSSH
jgi:hypothetical protein